MAILNDLLFEAAGFMIYIKVIERTNLRIILMQLY